MGKKNSLLAGFLISFTGAVLFSTKAIIIKSAFRATATDALTLLMLRMLFSLPFYLAAAVWGSRREGNVRMTGRQWMWVVILGLLGYYLSSYFDFVGLQYISAGLERLILFLYPSFAVLINAAVFGQKMTRVQLGALLLTYLGIGIAYFGELRVDTGNPNFFWGSLLVFMCAVTYAIYLSGTGRMIKVLAPAKFTTYSMLVAAAAVLLHFALRGLVTGDYHLPGAAHVSMVQAAAGVGEGLGHVSATPATGHAGQGLTPVGAGEASMGLGSTGGADAKAVVGVGLWGSGGLWTYAVLLALLATVIPSFMLTAGMRRIGANNAAIVTSIGPVSTILQAHFVLGDPIFFEQVLGTVLVIAGVLLIGWKSAGASAGEVTGAVVEDAVAPANAAEDAIVKKN